MQATVILRLFSEQIVTRTLLRCRYDATLHTDEAATFTCIQQPIAPLNVTTLIRELCEYISHRCPIFLMTLGDVLL